MRSVVATLRVAAMSVLLVTCGPPEERPPNVIVIALDTLRADALGCLGASMSPALSPTPAIDAFANEGVLFTRATASACWTLPSFTSMFTGLYPEAHGVLTAADRVPDDCELLAERLRDAGYATAAFTGGAYLRPEFGLDQGFDRFEFRQMPRLRDKLPAAKRWLKEQDGPSFLFVQTYDVHAPYAPDVRPTPPRGYKPPGDGVAVGLIKAVESGATDGLDPARVHTAYLTVDPPGKGNKTRFRRAYFDWRATLDRPIEALWRESPTFEQDVAWLRANYAAEVTQVDAELGAFLDWLKETGRLANTLVVVVSDHGEAFMEHGTYEHETVHAEVARVPLVIRPPGAPSPRRIDAAARGVDIAPTVLEYAGLPPAPLAQGRSLKAMIEGGPADDLPAACFMNLEGQLGHREASLERGDWKLILREPNVGLPSESLFHVVDDPGETRDLRVENAVVAARLRETLDRLRSQCTELRRHFASGAADLGDDAVRELQELGYLGGR